MDAGRTACSQHPTLSWQVLHCSDLASPDIILPLPHCLSPSLVIALLRLHLCVLCPLLPHPPVLDLAFRVHPMLGYLPITLSPQHRQVFVKRDHIHTYNNCHSTLVHPLPIRLLHPEANPHLHPFAHSRDHCTNLRLPRPPPARIVVHRWLALVQIAHLIHPSGSPHTPVMFGRCGSA